jgi:hypothetical protein
MHGCIDLNIKHCLCLLCNMVDLINPLFQNLHTVEHPIPFLGFVFTKLNSLSRNVYQLIFKRFLHTTYSAFVKNIFDVICHALSRSQGIAPAIVHSFLSCLIYVYICFIQFFFVYKYFV